MKKTKIQIGLGIALFLVMLGIIIVAVVSDSGKNYIENYVASIDVDESGGIIVEETVVVNYKQYMNYIKRNVKYNKVLTSGEPYKNYPSSVFSNSKANFNTNDVEIRAYRGNLLDENDIVTNITNDVAIVRSWDVNPYYYTESGARELTDGYLERVMCIDILKNSSDAYSIPEEKRLYGYMTFVYRYQIESMVNTYNDCAELNYVVFNETDMKIKNAKVTVTLPKQVSDINELRGYGHGLSNGLIEIAAPQSVVYTAKNITLEEDFEIRVLFPTGIVTETATNHVDIEIKDRIIYLEKHYALISNLSYIFNIVCIVLTVLTVLGMIAVTVHVYIKYDKEFTPEFQGIYLRELPYQYSPAIVGFVYRFGTTVDADVTAVLLDLMNRGFLKFDKIYEANGKKVKEDGIIRRTDKQMVGLLPFESDVVDLFLNTMGNGTEVKLSEIESFGKKYSDAKKIEDKGLKFKKDVKKTGDSYNFILNQAKDKSKAFAFVIIPIITALILVICNWLLQINITLEIIILAVISFGYLAYVATFKKRTKEGAEHYAKWNAFKKFLEDFSNMQDYEIPGIAIWEHFLVYATSLGVADKVMKQLRVKLPELFEEDAMGNNQYYSRYYLYHSINRINHSYQACRSNVHNAIAQHNASSGGGHGGGFSSGSSFGGGGGGFSSGR